MNVYETVAYKAAAALQPLRARFAGQTALVFASGPSLTQLWHPDRPIPCPSIAVNDAHRIALGADILHASDPHWWSHNQGVPAFRGLKTGFSDGVRPPRPVVELSNGGVRGFDPRLGWARTGNNSGHVGVHLAAQLGAVRIVLVGFDMRVVDGKDHFFGQHPRSVQGRGASKYNEWVEHFGYLAEALSCRGVKVLNATPDSALQPAFGYVPLEDVCPAPSV